MFGGCLDTNCAPAWAAWAGWPGLMIVSTRISGTSLDIRRMASSAMACAELARSLAARVRIIPGVVLNDVVSAVEGLLMNRDRTDRGRKAACGRPGRRSH